MRPRSLEANTRLRSVRCCAATVIALLSPAHASAGTLTLDLGSALELARKHSLELEDGEDALAAAEERRHAARARSLPRLSASARYTRLSEIDDPTVTMPALQPGVPEQSITIGESVEDQVGLRVTLDQPVFTGFALSAGRAAANYGVEAAERKRALAEKDLRLRVAETYYGLMQAVSLRDVARQSVALLEAQQERTETFASVGRVTRLAVAKVDSRLATARVSLVQAEGAVATAQLSLAMLLGAPTDTAFELTETLDTSAPAPEARAGLAPQGSPAELASQGDVAGSAAGGSADDLAAEALRQRDDLAAARAQASAAFAKARAERGALWPQVSLRLGYSYDRPNQRYFPTEAEFNDSWDASVVMSWSFWDFGATASTASAAEHDARIAARSVERIEDVVTLEVERARQELRRERERIAAAKQALESAELAFRVADETFNASAATSVEVLDAETELTSARAELLRARVGARLAEARLERARGL